MGDAAADWSQYSEAQLRCIKALDFTPPLHETHLRRRYDVRGSTIASLERLGLVARDYLADAGCSTPMPFLRLTQAGDAVKADWRRWNGRVTEAVTAIIGGIR